MVEQELRLCGYFCIVTSEEMSASQALIQYKGRDIFEKLFRADKSIIGLKSVRVQSSQSTSAKIFYRVCGIDRPQSDLQSHKRTDAADGSQTEVYYCSGHNQ